MKHAATLLIIHIAKVYTMDSILNKDSILENAFIAIYHDHIQYVGIGSYQEFVDKDTRIIQGNNLIAIPGFIDACFIPKPLLKPYLYPGTTYDTHYEHAKEELFRDMHSLYYQLMKNGVTTIAYPKMESFYEECAQRVQSIYPYEGYTAIDSIDEDMISCHYHPLAHPCIDPLYTLRLKYQKDYKNPIELLKQFTILPAKCLGLTHIGNIKANRQADIVLLEGNDIGYVLSQINYASVRYVIKKGTVQFPNILI